MPVPTLEQVLDRLVRAEQRLEALENTPAGAIANHGNADHTPDFLAESGYTKGDIVAAAATGLLGSLSVGSDGQVLQADAASTRGVKWATASGGAHPLLGATNHDDTVAQTPTRGSLVKANATPAWDELVVGGANQALFVNSLGTDLVWNIASSRHTYVFVPNAAVDVAVVTGPQLVIHHTSATAEANIKAWIDAGTAPTGASLIIDIEQGDTDDLDTVASWSQVVRLTLPAGQKSVSTTSWTIPTLTADRLLRINVIQVGSTEPGRNVEVFLMSKRAVAP